MDDPNEKIREREYFTREELEARKHEGWRYEYEGSGIGPDVDGDFYVRHRTIPHQPE